MAGRICSIRKTHIAYFTNILFFSGECASLSSNFQLALPPLSLSLSPCDFDLIPKMKEPLRGIRFRTVPEILRAVDRFELSTQQTLLKVSYDFHIAGNGVYTMLVTTVKDSTTSKHVSILYQL